jgi:hypothetical protein
MHKMGVNSVPIALMKGSPGPRSLDITSPMSHAKYAVQRLRTFYIELGRGLYVGGVLRRYMILGMIMGILRARNIGVCLVIDPICKNCYFNNQCQISCPALEKLLQAP